jgi:hypothetical protein
MTGRAFPRLTSKCLEVLQRLNASCKRPCDVGEDCDETGYETPTWFPRGRNAPWINMKVLGFLPIGGRKVAHHLRSAEKLLTVHLQRSLARNRPPQLTPEDITRAVDIAVEIERERHERYPFEWE